MASSISMLFLLCIISLLLCSCARAQRRSQPIVPGLSWTYHDVSCPNLESIVRNQLKEELKNDIGQAAGLLRLHFHDCFVQGCDASVLLDRSACGPGEQSAPPNLSLRAEAFKIINDLRRRVHEECGRVVSCADILALAARDAVFLSGGPDYSIPLGRRDSPNFATMAKTLANIPSPRSHTTFLLASLSLKNFTTTDVVALSGGHTIGRGHCISFTNRLYPIPDLNMDKTFAKKLKTTCPTRISISNTTVLDIRSPNAFDNKYYVNLMNRQGLFTSDQDLYTDPRTRGIVTSFAVNQTLFYEKFVSAVIKMSQLSVLTGRQGEIRADCSVRNSDSVLMSSTEGEEKEAWSAF